MCIKADDVHDDAAEDLSLGNGNLAKAALGLLPEYAPKLSDTFDEWLEAQRATWPRVFVVSWSPR